MIFSTFFKFFSTSFFPVLYEYVEKSNLLMRFNY